MNFSIVFAQVFVFFIAISLIAWIANYIIFGIGCYFGWFTKPLVKDHWWDKYISKIWAEYLNEREKLEPK